MSSSSALPSVVPFAAAVLAVVVLATVAGAAAGPGPDPCEVVRRAGRRMGRLGFQLRFTVSLTSGTPPTVVWTEMGTTTVTSGDFEMDFSHVDATGEQGCRLRSVAGRTFVRPPGTDGWELPDATTPTPSWDPVLVSRWLANAASAEDLGAANVPALGRLPLRRLSFRPSSGSFPGDSSSTVAMDAYLDPHGRVRWVAVTASWESATGPSATTMELEVTEGDGQRRVRVPYSMLELDDDGVPTGSPVPEPEPAVEPPRPDFVPAEPVPVPDFVPAEPVPVPDFVPAEPAPVPDFVPAEPPTTAGTEVAGPVPHMDPAVEAVVRQMHEDAALDVFSPPTVRDE